VSVDLAGWSCPLPLRDHTRIVLGHGGGGKLTQELVEHLFLPAFRTDLPSPLGELGDSAVFELPGGAPRLAFSTDTYVVRPLFFPGGSIGDLAVNGTINDVAMSGAVPVALSAGFVLEEGLELGVLGRVAEEMGSAARLAGVPIATGDTKVVESGKADGLYVTTAGFGLIPDGVRVAPGRAAPGDVVIVSGDIGVHGIAVLSVREGLEFGTAIETDSAPLHGLVQAMLAAGNDPAETVHTLRDPTRGGVAATLTEIARAAKAGIEIAESALPVPDAVRGACSFLGLDPLDIANEGKLVAFVPAAAADAVLEAMQAHQHGRRATVIGRVVDEHAGIVVARTPYGATRVIDVPLGEALPRIC